MKKKKTHTFRPRRRHAVATALALTLSAAAPHPAAAHAEYQADDIETNPQTAETALAEPGRKQTTTLRNRLAGSDQCMDLAQGSSKVVFNTCNGAPSQDWIIEPVSVPGYNTIKNSALSDGLCLHSSTNGNVIGMETCYSGKYTSQSYWMVKLKGAGNHSIFSKVQLDYLRNGELSVSPSLDLTLNDESASFGNWYLDQYRAQHRDMKGVVTVLFLNTHFTGVKEASTDAARKALFGGGAPYTSLSEYLTIASRGKLTVREGATLDNLDIGSPGSGCDSTAYREKAVELAKERGVNPDDYDVIYVQHSNNTRCSYAGLASYPSSPTSPGKYITANDSAHKYWMWSHEFGHTLGFRHSNILVDCPATETGVKIEATCRRGGVDGGTNDLSDTMGGGGKRMYPVNYMYEVGWLDDDQFPVVGNGTYKIDPLLRDGDGKQGLRIARDNPDFPYLTLEFRQPDGFDSDWPVNSPFINGVIVRQIAPRPLISYNELVHTVPGSSDRNTAPLTVGKTLYDTYSGKVITVLSVSSDGAIVKVEDH